MNKEPKKCPVCGREYERREDIYSNRECAMCNHCDYMIATVYGCLDDLLDKLAPDTYAGKGGGR